MDVSGQLYPPGKEPLVPTEKSVGGPQSRSRRRGVEKSLLPSSGHEGDDVSLAFI
jgi:hypothetical protein